MKLISINVAKEEMLETSHGLVKTGIIKEPVLTKVKVTELGIDGDIIVDKRVHGGADQALYLYSQEDYDWWYERLGQKLSPGIFGENLTISSFGNAPLKIGDRFIIGEIVIEVSAPRTPCFKLAARMGNAGFIKDFMQAERTGAYARVIVGGEIGSGDEVVLNKTTEDYPTVTEVFKTCHSKNPDLDIVHRALQSPLGNMHKEIIREIYLRYS